MEGERDVKGRDVINPPRARPISVLPMGEGKSVLRGVGGWYPPQGPSVLFTKMITASDLSFWGISPNQREKEVIESKLLEYDIKPWTVKRHHEHLLGRFGQRLREGDTSSVGVFTNDSGMGLTIVIHYRQISIKGIPEDILRNHLDPFLGKHYEIVYSYPNVPETGAAIYNYFHVWLQRIPEDLKPFINPAIHRRFMAQMFQAMEFTAKGYWTVVIAKAGHMAKIKWLPSRTLLEMRTGGSGVSLSSPPSKRISLRGKFLNRG